MKKPCIEKFIYVMNFQKTHRIHPHTLPHSQNRNFAKDIELFQLKKKKNFIKEKVKENGIEKIGPKFFFAPTKKSRKQSQKSKIQGNHVFRMTLNSKLGHLIFESKFSSRSQKPRVYPPPLFMKILKCE